MEVISLFDRLRRTFPDDPRLDATSETAQTWERLVRVDKAIGTVRTTVTTTAGAAAAIVRAALPSGDDQPSGPQGPQREPVRAKHEWSGPASLAVGPTTGELAVGESRWRRTLRPDLVVGWPSGWLRLTPTMLEFTPDRRQGSTVTVVHLDAAQIVDLELVPLGRRNDGVTVVSDEGDELWVLVEDRRKLDEMAVRLRYGDRS